MLDTSSEYRSRVLQCRIQILNISQEIYSAEYKYQIPLKGFTLWYINSECPSRSLHRGISILNTLQGGFSVLNIQEVQDTNSENGHGITVRYTNTEYPSRGLQGMKLILKLVKGLQCVKSILYIPQKVYSA